MFYCNSVRMTCFIKRLHLILSWNFHRCSVFFCHPYIEQYVTASVITKSCSTRNITEIGYFI